MTDNDFLIIKVKALNHGIGCLLFNDNDIDYRKDILKDITDKFYKEDENYIKLLSYILLSKSPKRIDNEETLDLFIDDLTGILNYKDLRKCYIENYEFRKGVELKEKQDKERKIKIDSLIASLVEKEKKYNFKKFYRDIFSDTIDTLKKEKKINSLLYEEKKEIFKKWSDHIVKDDDFYAIIGEIKKYCDKIRKDYTMALYSIYIKNQYHYYCRYSDYDATVCYYERGSLMNVLCRRIEKKSNRENDIENDMAKIFNILDNNTDNNDGYFDITTAKEQKVGVFFYFGIDIIRKLNSYTLLLEKEIEEEIEKINPQKQNKEYVNFENLIENKEKKDSIIDEHKEIYKEIQKKLNNYISYDGVKKYKAIINYKINNKNFNNIDGRSYFVMNSNTKRDICKFAQCFNITLKEAEKIFKNIEKKNINLNTKDSVTINMTDPNDFEKALIEVRNECLHKINPEKFKLL
ncbi:MAG: hypothetical protein SO179_01870 [Bacteroidales bacterium]|nr:hypothetical protein [Bacteroidales bacterium]